MSKNKLKKLMVRTVAALVMALVVIPAYFLKGGIYFHYVIRLGCLMAVIELGSIACLSKYSPIHISEFLMTVLMWAEVLVCSFQIETLPVRIVGGVILVCTATDVFAYLAGTFVGGQIIKDRPFPKTSPNKSYEGLIAGVMFGVIAAQIWNKGVLGGTYPAWKLILVVPCAILGDLLESRFKRLYGIKDSNDYLLDVPVVGWIEKLLGGRDGHGGYLDRLDSLALSLAIQILIFYI